MDPLYIFDLDGTLACCKHRRHYVERQRPHKDWQSFYLACDRDVSIDPVLSTMELLRKSGAEIWIFSGRSDEVRNKTVKWLADRTSFCTDDLNGPILTMRREGDYTPDHVLKQTWYDNMLINDKNRLVAVFDDRSRVVAMWRRNGVQCFQVDDGEF